MSSVTTLPKRPDRGGQLGRNVQVQVNIFPISQLEALEAFQYDVALNPELPAELSRQVFRQVELKIKEKHQNAWFVYDGLKNAFSTKKIDNFECEIYAAKDVELKMPPAAEMPRGGGFRGGRGGGRGGHSGPPPPAPSMTLEKAKLVQDGPNTEKVTVTIRFTKAIKLGRLMEFAQGKCAEDDSVLHASQCLQVALRYVPSLLFVPVGSNFFTPEGRTPMTGGLEIWRGYHQSVRAMMAGHLGINIDLASTVFRMGDMPLLEYLMKVCGCRDERDLANVRPEELNKAVKGVMVTTTHRGDGHKTRLKIAKLSKESAKTFTFESKDKQRISVAEYFETEYNYRLKYPDLPLAVKANGKTAFPLECLHIQPAQKFKSRLSGEQTSDMIRATTQKPRARKDQIEDAVRATLKYDSNEYLSSFGLRVEKEMMRIDTRVLPAPRVQFKDNDISGEGGVWNLRNARLVDAPPLESCAFVFFVRTSTNDAHDIRDTILKKWSVAGMNIRCSNVPVVIANPSIEGNIKGALMSAFKEACAAANTRCQMLVCIVDGTKRLYEQIKKITLCEAGVMSQCMLQKNVRSARDIKDQYIANVALKANIKLGGSTNTVDSFPSHEHPDTMFMGIDVTHPAPGSAAPSIAAVVASYDKAATKYNTYIRAQTHRVEIIEEMHQLTFLALQDFNKRTGKYPSRIVVYRDGVASGQFDQVRDAEVKSIKKALETAKIQVKLTVIVVQKRHHIRLFPTSDRDTDRSGNCQPGSVIDTRIMHPTEFNFYLQSHAGIQGMSRPTLYHVIHDESNMTSDQVQKMTYDLSFLSERATRSISVAAPSYRAHLAAFYARMFLDGEDASDTASVSSGSTMTVSLRRFAQGVENHMYYM